MEFKNAAFDPTQQSPLVQQRLKKKGNIQKWGDLKEYLWSPENNVYFGRSLWSWMGTSLFYLIFNAGVMVFFLLCLGVFSVIADEIWPTRQGFDTPLQFSPGLSFRPVSDFESRLIRFVQGRPSTYKVFTDHVRGYLEHYENELQTGENFIDCSLGRPPNMDEKVCRFDINTLGEKCVWQKDYGYDEGQPCILLKLNKIYDFRPQLYETEEEVAQVAPKIIEEGRFSADHVGVVCEGRYPPDMENIGNVSYWPPGGFSKAYWPYLNQEGYRAAIVMVKFDNPINGVVVNVVCKAYAKNIKIHENDELGAVTFSLLVD